jgi:rRNA maturation endonuclease Nob1
MEQSIAVISENPLKARPVHEIEEIRSKNTIAYDTVFQESTNGIRQRDHHNNNNNEEHQDEDNDLDNDSDDEDEDNGFEYVTSREYDDITVAKCTSTSSYQHLFSCPSNN